MIYTINEITNIIAPIAIKYNLAAVYIFGSYARGEATNNSDIDILVDKTGAALDSLFAMGGLFSDLEEAMDKKIDLVTTCVLEQEHTKERSSYFIECVNKEKINIYTKT
jgi:predicted nucleotidyltransferase